MDCTVAGSVRFVYRFVQVSSGRVTVDDASRTVTGFIHRHREATPPTREQTLRTPLLFHPPAPTHLQLFQPQVRQSVTTRRLHKQAMTANHPPHRGSLTLIQQARHLLLFSFDLRYATNEFLTRIKHADHPGSPPQCRSPSPTNPPATHTDESSSCGPCSSRPPSPRQ